MSDTIQSLDIHAILKRLPHRYPFLLVDKVLALEKGVRIKALKNITMNEPQFTGHFPEFPVMPGVLMVEALAQTAALLGMVSMDPPMEEGALIYFAGIDECRFKRVVSPGDQLILTASILNLKRGIGKFACQAHVDGQLAVEATLMAALKNKA
ncbi:MAG: 3-hydroxyacyl-[acyl-carrier-protein] dehydratase FabZ [Pseudomonadota bacterium]